MAQTDATHIVTLHPKGPLHVGRFIGVEREAALDWVPSDTLFGALVSAWAVLGQDVGELLSGFCEGRPPFLLTSAFPRAGEVRFYPRPWLPIHPANLFEQKHKRTKRLKWVSEGIFRRLVARTSLAGEGEDANFIQGESVWLTREEREKLPESVFAEDERGRAWGYQAAPRVTVDRADSASNLFHSGRVDFAADCGLWLGVRFLDAEDIWRERVKRALDYLADAGLGGLRSTGHGAFVWEWGTSLPGSANGKAYAITLSRYAPRDATELQATLLGDDHTAYRLVTVGGWCRDDALHPWRRRSVCLVTEGSLLAWDGHGPIGHLVDVTPRGVGAFGADHRVWRYGYAFPVVVAATVPGEENCS